MRAIITVVGQDTVGILAAVSQVCAEHNANVIEVTQSVMEELFVMVMLVNIDHLYWARENLKVADQKLHPHGHGWSIVNNVDQWSWL